MKQNENKIKRQYWLSPNILKMMEDHAAETGKTLTFIVEDAVRQYLAQDQMLDKLADIVIDKFDEKYGNFMTRVRLASRSADINTQLILELWNMSLLQRHLTEDDFVMSDKLESPVLRSAKKGVKERLDKLKQAKDSKGKE